MNVVSWADLNDFLRDATEEECLTLIKQERAGKFRVLMLNRVFCRYNRMRSQRERRELLS